VSAASFHFYEDEDTVTGIKRQQVDLTTANADVASKDAVPKESQEL
jgi:hypothetical protein